METLCTKLFFGQCRNNNSTFCQFDNAEDSHSQNLDQLPQWKKIVQLFLWPLSLFQSVIFGFGQEPDMSGNTTFSSSCCICLLQSCDLFGQFCQNEIACKIQSFMSVNHHHKVHLGIGVLTVDVITSASMCAFQKFSMMFQCASLMSWQLKHEHWC